MSHKHPFAAHYKGYAGPVTSISYADESLVDEADRDVPDECEACQRKAQYAVKFEDPTEIVFYCEHCKLRWDADDKAVDSEKL